LALGELLAILRGGLWAILGCTLAFLLLAGFYAWHATPIYRINAMLKVDNKTGTRSNSALESRVEGVFDESAQAQTELEILQSSTVLMRVVNALHLDLIVAPEFSRLSPDAWIPSRRAEAHAEVDTFQVPDALAGTDFTLKLEGGDTFSWLSADGQILAHGKPGDELKATWGGQPIVLKVRSLTGKAGQRFHVQRAHIQDCIEDLRGGLTIAEKSKDTNVLTLVLEYPDPTMGEAILNAIMDQYTDMNISRKTEEASKTLAFVREQMEIQKNKLMRSEQLLEAVRSGRSVDLGEEARLVLSRGVEIERDILALRQKRAELLRTYQERADVVVLVDQQIAKLQEEKKRFDAQGKSMPQTQQEVLRLTRDVQVNQDQYAALMNIETLNVQQLQMAKAGEAESARIVDRAMSSVNPVKPKKSLILGLGLVLGVIAGSGLVLLRYTLFQHGIKDPMVLEAHFGLPVLATIPHSANQDNLTRKARRKDGPHTMLTTASPDDLAVESLRSLRTSLHFTLVDSPNRAILIAGASPDIGKTFVSANFAILLAQFGARVLMVDADMRRGTLHRDFGVSLRKDGLSEILTGSLAWQKALHRAHGLDLISTGVLPPDPTKLLAGPRFEAFLTEVCAAYDYVIIDAPPILAVTDAVIIGSQVGSVLLVVKDGRHPLGEIRAAMQCLEIARIQPKGFIFNDVTPQTATPGYLNYTYYYAYQKQASTSEHA